MLIGANDFTDEELAEMFAVEEPATPPEVNPETPPAIPADPQKDVTATQSFAKRLKEEKEKAKNEAKEELAIALGYQSFAELQKAKEKELLKDNGLDSEQVDPIVEKLVNKRIAEDPRMKELETMRKEQVKQFAKQELKDLEELTGTKFKSIEEIPEDVREDWAKTGSLKKSYMALRGEELIAKARATSTKGTTEHLVEPSGGTSTPRATRLYTKEEKEVYRFFNPGVTDEELNKKVKEI